MTYKDLCNLKIGDRFCEICTVFRLCTWYTVASLPNIEEDGISWDGKNIKGDIVHFYCNKEFGITYLDCYFENPYIGFREE